MKIVKIKCPKCMARGTKTPTGIIRLNSMMTVTCPVCEGRKSVAVLINDDGSPYDIRPKVTKKEPAKAAEKKPAEEKPAKEKPAKRKYVSRSKIKAK